MTGTGMEKRAVMAVCAACALAGYAEVVIQFDGYTADAATAQSNAGTTGDQTILPGQTFTQSLAYSTTVPKFSPGIPINYLSGQPIFAGHYLMWSNASAETVSIPSTTAIAYRGGNHPEDLQIVCGIGTNHAVVARAMNFAVLFGLTPAAAGSNYVFDANSVLQITARAFQAVGTADNRWVVVAGGVTYVSSSTVGILTTGHENYRLSNPDLIRWAVWNPGEDMAFGSLTFNVSGSLIRNITHAGMAENAWMSPGTADRRVYIAGFEGNLHLIPEGGSAPTGYRLPLRENFEADGGVYPGSMDGQNLWEVVEGAAAVQTAVAQGGTQAVSVDFASVRRSFIADGSDFWGRFYIRMDEPPEVDPVLSDSGQEQIGIAFYINTNLNVVVCSASNTLVLSETTVLLGVWVQFDVFSHEYAGEPSWSLSMNGTPVAENLNFLYPGRIASFQTGSGVRLYLDDAAFSDREPDDLEMADTDGDGYPDWWEQKYFGHATAFTGQVDPGRLTAFRIGPDGSRHMDWIRLPGRHYDVYWTRDLGEEFLLVRQALQTDGFEETDENRLNEKSGFYKIIGR